VEKAHLPEVRKSSNASSYFLSNFFAILAMLEARLALDALGCNSTGQ
jgi:hypothetical protein